MSRVKNIQHLKFFYSLHFFFVLLRVQAVTKDVKQKPILCSTMPHENNSLFSTLFRFHTKIRKDSQYQEKYFVDPQKAFWFQQMSFLALNILSYY